MRWTHWQPGVLAALASAFLFGAGTPLAKWLLDQLNPWMLAGLLYLGSGLGLALYRWLRGTGTPRLNPGEMKWLVAAVLCGGGIAPVLLMYGLSAMPASHAALLLNAEAVLTALLAWLVFKENFDSRIAAGMAAIVAGALLLSWPANDLPAGTLVRSLWPALAVLLACLFWALDNNFTRKVALTDASWIACVKGLAAGATNLLLAFMLGAVLPGVAKIAAALLVGFLAYGVSLALFVLALRHLGASRTGAYFSSSPFVGALFSMVFFAEPASWQLLVAAGLMGLGIWLHLTEHHAHGHRHEALEHEHPHTHDEHHAHRHETAVAGPHSHRHRHEPLEHSHAHYPDAHHRHPH
ncbi:EamA family transporter [Polaromonas sp.]|uniref:DMT family transporter n=1 Tax=Polaromonas sp. TaxID=1869339 RepID=UPI00286A42AC|nr:EamA family transporter [Polaromonas sp.]